MKIILITAAICLIAHVVTFFVVQRSLSGYKTMRRSLAMYKSIVAPATEVSVVSRATGEFQIIKTDWQREFYQDPLVQEINKAAIKCGLCLECGERHATYYNHRHYSDPFRLDEANLMKELKSGKVQSAMAPMISDLLGDYHLDSFGDTPK